MAEFIKLQHWDVETLLNLIEQISDIRELTEEEAAARAKLELIRSNQKHKASRMRRHEPETEPANN